MSDERIAEALENAIRKSFKHFDMTQLEGSAHLLTISRLMIEYIDRKGFLRDLYDFVCSKEKETKGKDFMLYFTKGLAILDMTEIECQTAMNQVKKNT
jgi:hypothetical protein